MHAEAVDLSNRFLSPPHSVITAYTFVASSTEECLVHALSPNAIVSGRLLIGVHEL
jgi:hypothetical protein